MTSGPAPAPRVSTVIPTYNYGRLVGRAVASVLAQSYRPLDCIVVDDGSTDDTQAALATFGDRIQVIKQGNRGLSAARNTGIGAARGDLLAFLDADDVWKPEKIAKQVDVLRSDPSIAVVGCDIELIDGQGALLERIPMPSPSAGAVGLRELATRARWVGGSGSGALVRRGVFDEVGLFDESLTAAEDWDMWLRIAAGHRIANVREVLVSISRHGTGAFRNSTRMETNQTKVYEMALRRWPDALDARTRRQVRALIARDAAIELLHAGRFKDSFGRFLRSLREWPWQRKTWYTAARVFLRSLRS